MTTAAEKIYVENGQKRTRRCNSFVKYNSPTSYLLCESCLGILGLKPRRIDLIYYKDTGKMYTKGSFESIEELIYEVRDEVLAMKTHPGINGRWSQGYIVIFDSMNELSHLVKVL